MIRTDDPLKDFAQHDAEQQAALEKRPKCSHCGEHIQDEFAYFINDEWIRDDCMLNYRMVVG